MKSSRQCLPLSILVLGAVSMGLSTKARAHITIASGAGVANTTQEVTFGVGHGCSGTDTYRVRVEIPAGVTSVRPETSGFGKTSVEKDATGTITAVVWQKADEDALPSDTQYYKLTVRLKVPDRPFSTLYFPAHQTCRAADGTLAVVDWVGLPTAPGENGGAAAEPAPTLMVVPMHRSGWNKVTVASSLTAADLASYFSDASIVWKGASAFSPNPVTAALINTTAGASVLTELSANDEIWVRY